MKQKRYTEEQIAFALHQADSGVAVADIGCKMGVSKATFYRWKKTRASQLMNATSTQIEVILWV
jgi:putative transposase